MIEILTPVQYEPALDILNRINKLSISDKASLSIDAMQACKNPVGTGQPIIGKFCKEDNQGSLCCHLQPTGLDNYEYAHYQLGSSQECFTHVFAQRVFGVLIRTWAQRPLDYSVQWKTPNGVAIKTFDNFVWDWLPFEGDTIIICGSILQATFQVWLYGFY